jgi:hypothetical protein
MHGELVAARVVANEIGVANKRDLGPLSSTCAHVYFDEYQTGSMHRPHCTAVAAAEWDADAEEREKRKSCNKASHPVKSVHFTYEGDCHGDKPPC